MMLLWCTTVASYLDVTGDELSFTDVFVGENKKHEDFVPQEWDDIIEY